MKLTPVNGCYHCGISRMAHPVASKVGTAWHDWTPPTPGQRIERARTLKEAAEKRRGQR